MSLIKITTFTIVLCIKVCLNARKWTMLLALGKPKILTQQNQSSPDASSMSRAPKLHAKVSVKDLLKVTQKGI